MGTLKFNNTNWTLIETNSRGARVIETDIVLNLKEAINKKRRELVNWENEVFHQGQYHSFLWPLDNRWSSRWTGEPRHYRTSIYFDSWETSLIRGISQIWKPAEPA